MTNRVLRLLLAMAAAAAVGLAGAGAATPADQGGTGANQVAIKCYDWCSPQN